LLLLAFEAGDMFFMGNGLVARFVGHGENSVVDPTVRGNAGGSGVESFSFLFQVVTLFAVMMFNAKAQGRNGSP
jgi:hypothetical protein